MNKSMQIFLGIFLTAVTAVVLYFLNTVIENQNKFENKLAGFETKVADLEGALTIVKDIGKTFGREELPSFARAFKGKKTELKFIEAFYCNSYNNSTFSVLQFIQPNKFKVYHFEEERKKNLVGLDQSEPANIEGNYLLYGPYVYISAVEDGVALNNRFTLIQVREDGYIGQIVIGMETFSPDLCPQSIQNSY